MNDTRLAYIDPQDSLRLRGGDGLYERFETALVKRHLKPGQIFVDVGAHIGYYSVLAASIVGPTGGVYAYEPNPANVELLRANTEQFEGIVRMRDCAVSDAPGRAKLYLSATNSGDHQLFRSVGREAVDVAVISLDSDPALAGLSVNILKIDVQGLEVSVLRGARELIARSPSLMGIVEYSPAHLRLAGLKRPGDLLDMLNGMGLNAYLHEKKRRLKVAKPQSLKNLVSHTNLIISRGQLL
ncbi:MAG: FkbM family methyltransferase [Dehalococcoidia bacterium]|jgi:FkbM family methyltransferase